MRECQWVAPPLPLPLEGAGDQHYSPLPPASRPRDTQGHGGVPWHDGRPLSPTTADPSKRPRDEQPVMVWVRDCLLMRQIGSKA